MISDVLTHYQAEFYLKIQKNIKPTGQLSLNQQTTFHLKGLVVLCPKQSFLQFVQFQIKIYFCDFEAHTHIYRYNWEIKITLKKHKIRSHKMFKFPLRKAILVFKTYSFTFGTKSLTWSSINTSQPLKN